jgi:hypothetical protein
MLYSLLTEDSLCNFKFDFKFAKVAKYLQMRGNPVNEWNIIKIKILVMYLKVTNLVAAANICSAMEREPISKNRVSPKNVRSREKQWFYFF